MSKIKVLNPGLFTTLQDKGRHGYQQFGMPTAGAMDSYSMRIANYLVGNDPFEACLEATFMGLELEFTDTTCIAISGAMGVFTLNGKLISNLRNHQVKRGDKLKVNSVTKGVRVYLAVQNGFKIADVMRSKSTYCRAKLGGVRGAALKIGDEIPINQPNNFAPRFMDKKYLLKVEDCQIIRIIAGTEIEKFTLNGIQTFLNANYTITSQSDRMGYRLDGPKIEHVDTADIVSSGISNGAIQVPGNGKPIIMLADRQTVGGYTKIANVISVDLPFLGQMKPGDTIRFEEVNLDKAHELLDKQEKWFAILFDTH